MLAVGDFVEFSRERVRSAAHTIPFNPFLQSYQPLLAWSRVRANSPVK